MTKHMYAVTVITKKSIPMFNIDPEIKTFIAPYKGEFNSELYETIVNDYEGQVISITQLEEVK